MRRGTRLNYIDTRAFHGVPFGLEACLQVARTRERGLLCLANGDVEATDLGAVVDALASTSGTLRYGCTNGLSMFVLLRNLKPRQTVSRLTFDRVVWKVTRPMFRVGPWPSMHWLY